MRLTTKERILLHLIEHAGTAAAPEAPPEVAREGIARAAGVALRHVTQYVHALVREELVEEQLAHVQGHRQRRLVYGLTDAGHRAALRLRDRVASEVVRVREGAALREATVAEVARAVRGKASLVDVVRAAIASGVVDLDALTQAPAAARVAMLEDAPEVPRFIGRRRELARLTGETGARVFVVRGIAGMGKTWLAARVCALVRDRRNVFWHRVRPWDTRESLLARLGAFLAAVGKPGLRGVLGRGQVDRAPQVLREDLPGARAFLVFDDAHEGTADAFAFFRILFEAAASADDASVLVLTRRALPVYSRRDTVVRRVVEEIDLGGLESHDVAEYLEAFGFPRASIEVARRLRGHPLSLELLRAHNPAWGTIPDVRRYLEEEVYATLSDAERGIMKVASLYRVPVPADALFADSRWPRDALLAPRDRSLVRPVADERFEVHDTVREFFVGLLTPAERTRYRAFAVRQLGELATAARDAGKDALCANYLSDALQLAEDPRQRVGLSERLGDACARIGDPAGPMIAYREALKSAKGREVQARLHRKIAAFLEGRGDMRAAGREVEEGFRALGRTRGVERGWLHLVRARVLYDARAHQEEEWEEAREDAESALEDFRTCGDAEGEARAYRELGRIEVNIGPKRGRAYRADQHFENAIEAARRAGNRGVLAEVALEKVLIAVYGHGDVGEAERCLAEAESLLEVASDPQVRLEFLQRKSFLDVFVKGDADAAERTLAEALRMSRQVRDDSNLARTQIDAGLLAVRRGRVREARLDFEEAAEALSRLGHPWASATICWAGECCLMEGDVEGFRRALAASKDPSLEGRGGWYIYEKLLRAFDHLLRGDPNAAVSTFEKAVRDGEVLRVGPRLFGVVAPRVDLLYGVALEVLGREREAAFHFGRADDYYRSRNLEGQRAWAAVHARLLSDGLRRLLDGSRQATPGGVRP